MTLQERIKEMNHTLKLLDEEIVKYNNDYTSKRYITNYEKFLESINYCSIDPKREYDILTRTNCVSFDIFCYTVSIIDFNKLREYESFITTLFGGGINADILFKAKEMTNYDVIPQSIPILTKMANLKNNLAHIQSYINLLIEISIILRENWGVVDDSDKIYLVYRERIENYLSVYLDKYLEYCRSNKVYLENNKIIKAPIKG